jgi:hypothetical protein
MAQGKAWTQEERETIIQSLREYLELGFSRNKACAFIGLPPQTLSNWIQEDEALGMRITGFENAMNKLAMANLRDAMMKEGEMDDNRKDTSKWWAERKMKDDGFSTKTEQDITSGGKEIAPLLVKFIGDEPTNTD